MALFPAFAGGEPSKAEDSTQKDLDWLNNKSFRNDDAFSLHLRTLEKTAERPDQEHPRLGREASSEEEEEEEKEKGEEDEERDEPPKKKKKKKEKKRKKKKKHKKRSERSSDSSASDSDTVYPSDLKRDADSPQAAPLASRFSWLDDLQSPTQQPFCVDRKPDAANWTYRSLYRGDVATYRRKGSWTLGLDPRRQQVTWEDPQDANKKQKSADKRRPDRYFSSASRHMLRSEAPAPTLPTIPEGSGDAVSSPATSYLPLGGEVTATTGATAAEASGVNPLGVYDPSTERWLQGKGQREPADAGQPHDAGPPPAGRTEDYNRRLREQPTDTQLWIDFIQYQDEQSAAAFGAGGGGGGEAAAEHHRASHRAVQEKKLSIAERALAANPGCVPLQLERLNICQELWEPAALAKEWKKLVFLHPNSAPLWRRYLLFTQSHFSTFSVSKVNAAYGKCLSTLSAVQDGSMVSHPALPGTEESMLDIFTQQCHFLRQSGHSEKAISLFQALIDFTFYKPDSVQHLATRQQVEFFETFWDSGEARIGEVGARGWKAWMLQQERGGWLQPNAEEDDEEEEDEEEVKDHSQPRWRIWLDVEASREAAHWLPWRPDKSKGQSVEDCEDPDRQVLFDDVGASLIRLQSPDLRLRLLLSFLSFLGLPVDPVLCGTPCQQHSLLLDDLSLLAQGNDPQQPLTSHDLPAAGVHPAGHMTTLLASRRWAGLGRRGEEFVSNALHMLLPLVPAPHRAALTLCWVRYEKLKVWRCVRGSNKKRLRSQGKSSKRVAKRLLKEPDNRSSLALWREYAHLEWLLGNRDDARKVFGTAVASAAGVTTGAKAPPLAENPALCELCLLWAQLEVEAEEEQRLGGDQAAEVTSSPAVRVLTALAEGTATPSVPSASSQPALSPVSILKARRTYEQSLAAALSALEQALRDEGKEDVLRERLRVSGVVGCHALFQYLTVGVQAADAVYAEARERLEGLRGSLGGYADTNGGAATEERTVTSEVAAAATNRRLAHESQALALQHAALLRRHTIAAVFPLATLRRTLTAALSAWPHSAPLWSLYTQVENRYHSAGRARRFYHSVTRRSGSIVPRLFAIVAEQHRKRLVDAAQGSGSHGDTLPILPENGLSNRIRGLFESTIATEAGAHCPLLWRMYMHFLVSEGKVDKARGMFYKALQNIPWAKGLYMDAIQLFPEHLQEFVDLMTEKELRLRLPLEELDILLED